MANWNNAYYGNGDSQNYNYVPSLVAGNNDVLGDAASSWNYYPVPGVPLLNVHPFPSSPSQECLTAPIAARQGTGTDLTWGYGNGTDYAAAYGPSEASLAIAAASSLTPTAGEFVPRQTFSQTGEHSQRTLQSNDNKAPPVEHRFSNSRQSRDWNNQANRRQNGSDFKRPNSRSTYGYNRENTNNGRKGGGWFGSSNSNSKYPSMEDVKSQDRQRLLAEAAAFLSPSANNASSAASREPVENGETKSSNTRGSIASRPRGQEQQSHPRAQEYNRVFTNSGRYNNSSASLKSSATQDSEGANYSKRWSFDNFHKNQGQRGSANDYQRGSTNEYHQRGSANEHYQRSSANDLRGSTNEYHPWSNANDQRGSANEYHRSSGNEHYQRGGAIEYNSARNANNIDGKHFRSTAVRHPTNGAPPRVSPKRDSQKYGSSGNNIVDDDASQRERLSEQLSRGTLECLVCCERVRQYDPVWSCSNCYHVLHLKCIKKWAKSSKAESGWRCPACQNVTQEIPHEYHCFCGKVLDPEWNRNDAAHSCGEVCGRSRSDKRADCTHRCTLLCHPGPCPICTAQVTRSCGCGKLRKVVKCGSDQALLCGEKCGKELNCGLHHCTKTCHVGECPDCEHLVQLVCYCGKEQKEVACTKETADMKHFSCEGKCERPLACGNHKCEQVCHSGSCIECQLTPDKVTHCPCGKTALSKDQARSSCKDPIPTCSLVCGKKLSCGQPASPHTCEQLCHTGPCAACPRSTMVRCRCGNMDREIPCGELTTKADDARCEKKCTKKRSCGKHKCNQLCCIDVDHVCPLLCNHQLTCGQHRCEEPCHRGHCRPCWRTSFEELYCECGASVIMPPVPCGTRRPECSKPCSRPHSCEHPALHNCHSEPQCPPCTVLTQKWCYGKHELRKSVPCYMTELSCGLPCNVPLPCGRHKCILPCHKGSCLKEGQLCTQPCTMPRPLCGHNCAAPCHEGPCPDTPCKVTVKVTCECGHRSASRACSDNAKEYQRVATSLLASKMADMQLGHSVDIGDVLGNPSARKMALKTLECTEECRVIERNRRLAIGLQIVNPDLSAKLTPRYSDFMRQWAKKDPNFCNMVYEKLCELVQLAKQSKQKSRSYSFDSMNRDKRHFVHEYCEHFGCESVAYDQEPKRNVVATACKDKCWMPGMSLLEVIQRENGQRKVPKPVFHSSRPSTTRTMDVLPIKCSPQSSQPPISAAAAVAKPAPSSTPTGDSSKSNEEEPEIDYFDFT